MHDLKNNIVELKKRLDSVEDSLSLPEKRKNLEILERKASEPNFWDNQEEARKVMQELGDTKNELQEIDEINGEVNTLFDLAQSDELSKDLEKDYKSLLSRLEKVEISSFLSGKYDKKNAIFSIHAGQGGTEAMDWTSMLYRMYTKYCEYKNWKTEVIDLTSGEEAGIKSIVFRVSGTRCYGYLKNESGTHRLVRQSPFNADKLRQTSFALVEVMPELDEIDSPDIEIKDDDIEIQFFRASSQGGQNVQKVSTAVRIKHTPTGTVVTAQTERYQEQNRKNALALLRAKLWALEEEKRAKEKESIQGEYTPATWGTQIRSYVLHPYKMVKDLRTEIETSDAEGVLDGNLDEFVEAEIKLNT